MSIFHTLGLEVALLHVDSLLQSIHLWALNNQRTRHLEMDPTLFHASAKIQPKSIIGGGQIRLE